MPDFVNVALKNDGDSNNLHAYVTGIALQHGNQRCLMKANGRDLYFPTDPPAIGSPLTEDCAIPLGPPGNTVHLVLPQIAGGRIWIAEGHLTFLLNPGPALVEPSVLNPSDPNAVVNFGFCEFTINNDQLFANISYVDFVPRIPIALSLRERSGQVQRVTGIPPDGLDRIAEGLRLQSRQDHQPWDKLVVADQGRSLRILNATHGNAVNASFDSYFDRHVEQVWAKYSSGEKMRINTQAGSGIVEGHVNRIGELVIGSEIFQKPSSADILGCNSGPFTTGPSPTRNAIIPRLAAAFVRTSLLDAWEQPSHPTTYYRTPETNHYARVVHLNNIDGRGYAFAYDDVGPDGVEDQCGKVNAGDPELFTVLFGGKTALSWTRMRQPTQAESQQRMQDLASRRPPPIPPQHRTENRAGWRDMAKEMADKFLH